MIHLLDLMLKLGSVQYNLVKHCHTHSFVNKFQQLMLKECLASLLLIPWDSLAGVSYLDLEAK